MTGRRATVVVAGLTPLVLALSLPGSLRDAYGRGGMMGILLDAAFPWVILGVSHPGAALVVGPVLIVGPYSLARGLANRFFFSR